MLHPPYASTQSRSVGLESPVAATYLLPSEMRARRLEASETLDPVPSTSFAVHPAAPATPKAKSRNDLFSLDWSNISPNLPSRASPPTKSHLPSTNSATTTAPRPRLGWLSSRRMSSTDNSKYSKSVETNAPKPPRPLTPPSPNSAPNQNLLQQTQPIYPSLDKLSLNRSSTTTTSLLSPPPSLEMYSPEIKVDSAKKEVDRQAGQSENPVLDARQGPRTRLLPSREYLLGQGRHASVYLASFVPRDRAPTPNENLATAEFSAGSNWKLCAAKRILPDRESQLAGLGEAFILSKLMSSPLAAPNSIEARGSRSILKLYAVKDERDGLEPLPQPEVSQSSAASTLEFPSGIGLGRPTQTGSTSRQDFRCASEIHLPLPQQNSLHRAQRRSLRREKSFLSNKPNLSPPIASPYLDTPKEYFLPAEIEPKRKGPRHSEPPAPRIQHEMAQESPRNESTNRHVSINSSVVDSSCATERNPQPRIILLLEFCAFGHTQQFLHLHPEFLTFKLWLEWAKQIVAAVAWAHSRGVLHADIKPQNVLVCSDLSVRLSDFGMSMFLPSQNSNLGLPTDPIGLGTPAYAPPEFVRPAPSPFSRPADIFSLGVTLNTLITGIEPFEGMRSVERMLWIARGGYWDWSERRRENGRESEQVSRAGSIRSVKSGRSRTSSASGVWLQTNSLRRQESFDSQRSFQTVNKSATNLTNLAANLLAPENCNDVTERSTPLADFFSLANQTENFDQTESEEFAPSPTDTNTSFASNNYTDGTPFQYFPNQVDVVPLQLRELLKAMTSPKEEFRPSALQVLAALDRM